MAKEYNTSMNLNSSYNKKTVTIGGSSLTNITHNDVNRVYGGYVSSHLFGIIVTLLIFIALFKVLSDSQPFTFQGFIEQLGSLPRINFSFTRIVDLTITGDWGVLEFLRNVINGSITILNIGVWLCKMLVQGIIWLSNFIMLVLA